ncbi:Uracil-DNA glycosylase [Pleurotus pulmonarius]
MPKELSVSQVNRVQRASIDAYFTKKPSARSVSTTTKSLTKDASEASSSKAEEDVSSIPECPSATALAEATIGTLEEATMGRSWFEALKKEFTKPYFVKLKKDLASEQASHTIYPELSNIYSWSRFTSLDSVKVVILGQDPYHNVGQAHGLSFSVLPPTSLPGSLRNIYKQMSDDIPGFKSPTSGDLSPLAKQGVLWLNTSLTVRAHAAGSHSKLGWSTFTAEVIRAVISRKSCQGVVFLAWGLPAQKTCQSIGIDKVKHLVLKSAHPSPLSAHRGFLGNGHFAKANKWLSEKYGEDGVVDWAVLCR